MAIITMASVIIIGAAFAMTLRASVKNGEAEYLKRRREREELKA